MTYAQMLLDPRWQRKRLEIFQRDDFMCCRCLATDKTLVVHHRRYVSPVPWLCPDEDMETLCDPCHEREHRRVCGSSLFELKQLAEAAHASRDWNDLWRISHLIQFDESDEVRGHA